MAERPDQMHSPLIGLEAAKAEFDRRSALFVDVRDYEAFKRSHIAGSISIPLRELLRRLGEFPGDRRIVFV